MSRPVVNELIFLSVYKFPYVNVFSVAQFDDNKLNAEMIWEIVEEDGNGDIEVEKFVKECEFNYKIRNLFKRPPSPTSCEKIGMYASFWWY